MSRDVASKNNLNIGDVIELDVLTDLGMKSEKEFPFTITIVGIYEVSPNEELTKLRS
jgi:hypothetical protein